MSNVSAFSEVCSKRCSGHLMAPTEYPTSLRRTNQSLGFRCGNVDNQGCIYLDESWVSSHLQPPKEFPSDLQPSFCCFLPSCWSLQGRQPGCRAQSCPPVNRHAPLTLAGPKLVSKLPS